MRTPTVQNSHISTLYLYWSMHLSQTKIESIRQTPILRTLIMSSSVTFNKAVNANNDGVASFESGRFEDAKDTFERSLAMMREAIMEASKESLLLPIRRSAPSKSSEEFHWSEIPNRVSHAGCKRPRGDHISCSSSFFFQRAIILMETTIQRSAEEYGEETSAVVYNLALACHCMSTEKNSDAMLKRAVQFYKVAHSIFVHRSGGQPRPKGKRGMIMVIMNNLGQLHYDRMLEYTIAERCFQRLLNGLRDEEQQCGKHTRNGFGEEDFRGFMLNVMLERPLLSAAA
jgi:hypothetical protein